MTDLTTTYLGMHLKNPLVASASPLSEKLDTARRLEDAGISALVMYSLFEEQIIKESLNLHQALEQGSESFAEALTFLPTFLPEIGRYSMGADKYLEQIRLLKQHLEIPVIASLNGVTSGGWTEYAHKIEQAGADALELNIYSIPTDPEFTSLELEDEYIKLVREVRGKIQIPIAVKISPYFTALPNFARRLVNAGANGLVLFNRFYQPDFDLDTLEVVPHLVLSSSHEMRLPLRWIAMLYKQVQADFALTSGIHSSLDVLKAVMAGSSVAMMASALLKYGPERASLVLGELNTWMEDHEYESIQQMKGSMSQQAVAKPGAYERANYMKELNSFKY